MARSLTALLFFPIVLLPSYNAESAISPCQIDEMKEKAPERLQVEVVSVTKGPVNLQRAAVDYEAKVLSVGRTASNVKAGDTITIHVYIGGSSPDIFGPRIPSLLSAKWKGTVYLHSVDEGKGYGLAVFGHSFEKDAKKRDDYDGSVR